MIESKSAFGRFFPVQVATGLTANVLSCTWTSIIFYFSWPPNTDDNLGIKYIIVTELQKPFTHIAQKEKKKKKKKNVDQISLI